MHNRILIFQTHTPKNIVAVYLYEYPGMIALRNLKAPAFREGVYQQINLLH